MSNVMQRYEMLKAKVVNRKEQFDNLISFIEVETEWLTAPASTKFHLCKQGGLLEHSCNVADTMIKLKNAILPNLSDESCVIVALFHDLGKVGMPGNPQYLMNEPTEKQKQYGYSATYPYRFNTDLTYLSVPVRSIYLILPFLTLSEEEVQAIRKQWGRFFLLLICYNLPEVKSMSRHARVQSPTDYYHVMMRGNNRESIFSKDEQKRYFLESLKMQDKDQLIDTVAYCLMDNHAHIVAKANISDLSKAIKRINIKYAMNFNQKPDRIGHVFQDRFKSEAIEDDKYLLQVIRYIHNNPVTAKIVKSPVDYNWSSYNEYMNKNVIIESQQREFILEYFSHNLDRFLEFHKQKDNNEFLEIKEDIENERLEQAQDIISAYFTKKGLFDAKQVINNPVYIEEIIQDLLKGSRLTHRQIVNLLGISNNVVHKVNLHKG